MLLVKPRTWEYKVLESESCLGSGPDFEQDNYVPWDCLLILEIEVIVSVLRNCGSIGDMCKVSGT